MAIPTEDFRGFPQSLQANNWDSIWEEVRFISSYTLKI